MNCKILQEKFERITSHLDEKSKRLWCANEAIAMGRGGVAIVSAATGISRTTVTEGIKEIKGKKELPEKGRIRRKGGGRKKKTQQYQTVKDDIENLIEPFTLGSPESSLRWICKSTRNLAKELNKAGYEISHCSVANILKKDMNYSLQANRKTGEGEEDHPDRNAQFCYINKKAKRFQEQNQPAISVDTKKKENVGNYKNNGREYCKKNSGRSKCI